MSDEQAVMAELAAVRDGEREVITDGCARTIAAWWHSPSTADVPMSALSHTGAVDVAGLLPLVERNKVGADTDTCEALDALAAYARHHGDRGPVDGWSNVWVR